jgi:enoyl-CoA hydratase/carnithine racemase
MRSFERYRDLYPNIHFERRGTVVQLRLHTRGGPLKWGALDGSVHTQLGDAFRDVGRDTPVRCVILTGTGASFCAEMEPQELPSGPGGPDWTRLMREGRELLMNFLEIGVPVVSAVNGPAYIHCELPVLADIVLASATADFGDLAHFAYGVVPGDGVHVVWPMLLGPNRGRYFLLTGQRIGAREAHSLGVVSEVLPPGELEARSWELAAAIAGKPEAVLRGTRAALNYTLRKRVLEELGCGLALEGLALLTPTERNAT